MIDGQLPYDFSFDYARDPLDARVLPRLRVAVRYFPNQERPLAVSPVLDTGAEMSVFDGVFALAAGWTYGDIVERAHATELIYGVSAGPPVRGYVHHVECLLGSAARFADLRLRVLITPPDSIVYPILGRDDFFRQVDVTFAEFERRLYLRFRDQSVLHDYRDV